VEKNSEIRAPLKKSIGCKENTSLFYIFPGGVSSSVGENVSAICWRIMYYASQIGMIYLHTRQPQRHFSSISERRFAPIAFVGFFS
jgi:hypothetical protein